MNVCQHCGKEIGSDAVQGICPACLLKAGLGSAPLSGSQQRAKAEPPTVERLRELFPQLEILEFLGQGGMGAVYKARQPQLDRVVALKILLPDVGSDPAFAERFIIEARALAKLNHPNIITIHDFGQVEDLFYFVMEFVDGLSLRQLLAAERMSPREALAIVPQICDALQFAHDTGIVHRDIKPENILMDRLGRVKVADFGLAKLMGSAEPTGQNGSVGASFELSEAGLVLGTPQYMAPEQMTHPRDVDHRADIYALGVVFYQMLTGELPGKSLEPPSKKVQIDVRLDEVVLRALEKLPELRYQHVSDVKTMVETIAATQPVMSVAPEKTAQQSSTDSAAPRSCRCYISTPERLQNFWGTFIVIYDGKGVIHIDKNELVFSDSAGAIRIPLRSICDLRIGNYSLAAKPVRLDYIAVTYDEGEKKRTLLFTPAKSGAAGPWQTNILVAEWFNAIRTNVASARGEDVSDESSRNRGLQNAIQIAGGIIFCFVVCVGICTGFGALMYFYPLMFFAMVGVMILGVVLSQLRIWPFKTALLETSDFSLRYLQHRHEGKLPLETRVAPQPLAAVQDTSKIHARKKIKGEFFGIGCALQAIGLGTFFIPHCFLLGLALLVIGGRLALKTVCSSCGQQVKRNDKQCPGCGASFDKPNSLDTQRPTSDSSLVRNEAGRVAPRYSFALVTLIAITTLSIFLGSPLFQHEPDEWLFGISISLGCVSALLSFLLPRFVNRKTLGICYQVGAWAAFVATLIIIGIVCFCLICQFTVNSLPSLQRYMGDFLLIMLGIFVLGFCGIRLWRASSVLLNAENSEPAHPAPAWKDYIGFSLSVLPVLIAWVFAMLFLVPKILDFIQSLPPSGTSHTARVVLSAFDPRMTWVPVALLCFFIIAEQALPFWKNVRRVALGMIAGILNVGLLFPLLGLVLFGGNGMFEYQRSAVQYVRIVAGQDKMTFQGKETTWDKLPDLLKEVPNRSKTVLELAFPQEVNFSSADKSLADAFTGRGARLAKECGFSYLSNIGTHMLGSRGTIWGGAKLAMQNPIPMALVAGTADAPELVKTTEITFQADGELTTATLHGSLASLPKSAWHFHLQLEDIDGRVVGESKMIKDNGEIQVEGAARTPFDLQMSIPPLKGIKSFTGKYKPVWFFLKIDQVPLEKNLSERETGTSGSAENGYRIQASPKLNHDEARMLAADLRQKGYLPEIVPEGEYQRVYLGNFASEAKANDLRAHLVANGYPFARVVKSDAIEASSKEKKPDPALLKQLPELRFLAWQDRAGKSQQDRDLSLAWRPDGSPIDAKGLEGQLLLEDNHTYSYTSRPEIRYLQFWVAHPLFDLQSENEFEILNDADQVLKEISGGTRCSGPFFTNGNIGWLTHVGALENNADWPARVKLRLRYTIDPWQEGHIVPVDYNGTLAFDEWAELGPIGQNSKGNAFITIQQEIGEKRNKQYNFVAVTRDGRHLTSNSASGSVRKNQSQNIIMFDVPLSQVKEFRLRTRPMRETIIPNVPILLDKISTATQSNTITSATKTVYSSTTNAPLTSGTFEARAENIQRRICRLDFLRAITAAEELMQDAKDDLERGKCHALLARAYHIWGVEYRNTEAREKGRLHLEKAFALNPAVKTELDMAQVHAYLYVYRSSKSMADEAVARVKKEIEADSKNSFAWYYLGMLHHFMAVEPSIAYSKAEQDEQRRLAIENMAKAVELNPKRCEFWLYYVSALSFADRKEEAKKAADRMMQESDISQIPRSSNYAYEVYAGAHFSTDKDNDAYFSEQAAKNPDCFALQWMLIKGEKDAAKQRAMYADVVDRITSGKLILPQWQAKVELSALYYLADLDFQAGDKEKALAHYNRIIELSPNFCMVRYNRGNLYLEMATNPDVVMAEPHMTEYKIGMLEKARQDYEAQLQYPWHDQVADTQRALDKVKEEMAKLGGRKISETPQSVSSTTSSLQKPAVTKRFVRLVIGSDKMTFEGREVTAEQLPGLLQAMPDRANTVWELAFPDKVFFESPLTSSAQMKMREAMECYAPLASKYGFAYLSFVGYKMLGSRGTVRFEGPLELDKDIPTSLTAGTADIPELVRVTNIRFRAKDGSISADIQAKLLQAIKSRWQFHLEFLNAQGAVIGQSSSFQETDFISLGDIVRVLSDWQMEIRPDKPVRFVLEIDQVPVEEKTQ